MCYKGIDKNRTNFIIPELSYPKDLRLIKKLVTDRANTYVRSSDENAIELVYLKMGRSKKDICDIQRINNHRNRLKRFITFSIMYL